MTVLDRTDIILSIIICTYNRNYLIKDCLNALVVQIKNKPQVEILIINNFHDLYNHEELELIVSDYPQVILKQEKIAGLSIARNRGLKESNGKWLAYIDDDALVSQNYISLALDIISSNKYDCFGGDIRSWWKYGQPKWLSENYGSKPPLSTVNGVLHEGYNWGSNMLFSKSALIAVEGFPIHIGMKGHKIGYAAENYVQKGLRSKGYIIGYHPELYVEHLVDRAKLKWTWHIKAAYAEARDGRFIFPNNYTLNGYLRTMKRIVKTPFLGLYKWFSTTNYYWQNLLIDLGKPWATMLGKLRSRV